MVCKDKCGSFYQTVICVSGKSSCLVSLKPPEAVQITSRVVLFLWVLLRCLKFELHNGDEWRLKIMLLRLGLDSDCRQFGSNLKWRLSKLSLGLLMVMGDGSETSGKRSYIGYCNRQADVTAGYAGCS